MGATLLLLTKIVCTSPVYAVLMYNPEMHALGGALNANDMNTRHIFFFMAFYRNLLQLWHAFAFDLSNKSSRLYTIVFVYMDMFVDILFAATYLYYHSDESATMYTIYHCIITLMSLHTIMFFPSKKHDPSYSPV